MDQASDYSGVSRSDLQAQPELVRSLLEEDQLVDFKSQTKFGRRHLSGKIIFLLWALRIYVIFMFALVVLVILHAFH